MRTTKLWWTSGCYSTIFALVLTPQRPLAGIAQSLTKPRQHVNTLTNTQICSAIMADKQRYQVEGAGTLDGCQITETTSGTDDSAATVLADVGGMGASTDAVVLYRLDHGTVTAAKFKNRKGEIWEAGPFLRGSSVMHSDQVKVSPSQHAFFTTEITGIGESGAAERCEAHAYQWIPKLGMYVERASRKTDELRCHP